jgi:hypothetical protein
MCETHLCVCVCVCMCSGVFFGVRSGAVARQRQQWGGVFFLVRSEAVTGQQWGGVFILVRSKAVTGMGGTPLLFALWNTPWKWRYIGQVNPNCKRMKWVPGASSPGVKRSGREAEIQRVFLSLQCLWHLGGLRAGQLGLDSQQGQDVSLLPNVQTGSGAHPASYPLSIGGSFSGGKTVGAWSWDTTGILITPVSVASWQAMGWTAWVGFLAGARCFSYPKRPDRFWGPPTLLSMNTGVSFSMG